MRKTGVLGGGLVSSVGRIRIRDVEYRSPRREEGTTCSWAGACWPSVLVVSMKIRKGKERQGKGKARDGDVCREKKCQVLCLELPVEVKDSSFSFELAQVDHIILHPRAKRLRVLALISGRNIRRSQLCDDDANQGPSMLRTSNTDGQHDEAEKEKEVPEGKQGKGKEKTKNVGLRSLELPIDLKDSSVSFELAQSNTHHLAPEGEASAHPSLR